jgi:hypothetical protein
MCFTFISPNESTTVKVFKIKNKNKRIFMIFFVDLLFKYRYINKIKMINGSNALLKEYKESSKVKYPDEIWL